MTWQRDGGGKMKVGERLCDGRQVRSCNKRRRRREVVAHMEEVDLIKGGGGHSDGMVER